MRCFILGFVAGVAYLQTWAVLPSRFICLMLVILSSSAVAAVFLRWRRHVGAYRMASFFRIPPILSNAPIAYGSLLAIGTLCGIVWAACFAHITLADSLSKTLEGRSVILIGVVDSMPDQLEGGVRFAFLVERVIGVNTRQHTVPRHIMLSWYHGMKYGGTPPQQVAAPNTIPKINPGERWQLTVRLKRVHGNANPMGFDTERRMLEQGIRATGYVYTDKKATVRHQRLTRFVSNGHNVIAAIRTLLRHRIQVALGNRPYAGVITALVVGDQKAITPNSWDVFRKTGVSHLVAISGLHITLVAGTLAGLFGALWRRSFFTRAQLPLLVPVPKAIVLASVVVALGYVLLAGFGVPGQRALYMLMVVACAQWFARLTPVLTILLLALWVVVVFDPWAVLSAGFWLSFGAVAIIMYTTAGRNRHTKQDRDRHKNKPRFLQYLYGQCANLNNSSRTQYAVTLGLLPMTVFLFGQYSLVSPIANAVAIPAVTLLVAPLSLIGSVLPMPVSGWMLTMAHAVLAWLSIVLQYLSDLPFAVWRTAMPAGWMFIVATIGTLLLLAPKGWPLRWLGCIGWLPLITNTASAPEDHGLWLTAFDVGQGMSLLVETAHHRLLYDTGPSYSQDMDAGQRIVLPYLGARGIDHLDTLVVSHSDDDHAGGALSILNGVAVDHVASSLVPGHAIVRAAASYQSCARGQHWTWDGVEFMFLHPTDDIYQNPKIKPNGRSCVLRITAGKRVILLAGDIEAPQEKSLLNKEYPQDLKADVLLVPHHGSGTSSTDAFLQAVQPSIALFQMGYLNHFHHPKPVVWARYGALGVTRFRSDTDGAIELAIHPDGRMETAAYRTRHARYWYGQ